MRVATFLPLLCWLQFAIAGQARAEARLVAIPAGRDSDLRFFAADGTQLKGLAALRQMSSANLTLWVAGNQFFAMPDVIAGFQREHPGTAVGLLTLPPGLILEAIQAGGWTYAGERFPALPDVYGTVSLDQLQATGHADTYAIYMHNALELMVARGNPKHVKDLGDLARPDLKVTLPNPLTEGIMSVYGKPLLVRLGLWNKLSPGADCAGCDPTPTVHFAVIHHREIPSRILSGAADVGLVWRTEVLEAQRKGDAIDGVALPVDQQASDKVSYLAGMLRGTPHAKAAHQLLEFLVSPGGQAAYMTYGFMPASEAERHLRTASPR